MTCYRRSAWSPGRAREWNPVPPTPSASPRWLLCDPKEDHRAVESVGADDRHPAHLDSVYGTAKRADPVTGVCGAIGSQRDGNRLLFERDGFAAFVKRAEIIKPRFGRHRAALLEPTTHQRARRLVIKDDVVGPVSE